MITIDDIDTSIDREIITGLIVSTVYGEKVKPIWKEEYVADPELRRVARWLLGYHKDYNRAPVRDTERLYLDAVKNGEISDAEAEFIDRVLSGISKDWVKYCDEFNPDFLYDRTILRFCQRHVEIGNERAEVATKSGRVSVETLAIVSASYEAIEDACKGNLSQARVASWRAATVVSAAAPLPDPWGEPEPPTFDILLPRTVREFAQAQSRLIGCDVGAMAWSAIAACSAALDGSIRLQMKPNDPSFTVPPGIWLLLVGKPSSRKSPTLKAAFAPLSRVQKDRINKSSDDPESRWEQLITQDPTPEGIRDVLVDQKRGIIVYQDEWGHFIGAMGRYSGGRDAGAADRAFYNTGYEGGPWASNRANRKGGERILVPNLQMTVVGGIQPDVLRQFNRGNALTNDGMLQRACVVLMGKPVQGEDVDVVGPIMDYGTLIRRLVAIPGGCTLSFAPEAKQVRERVEDRLLQYEQMESFGQGFTTAAGKLHGIFGRLALTLAFVKAKEDKLATLDVVDGKAASLAERLVLDSLIPNMARFYQSLGGEGDSETTKAIASFLLREQKVRVTPTDIIHHVQAVHNRKADQVRDEVSPLIVMGWLTPEGDDERRARAWIVNQAIYTQFAERAAQAKMQAALAREAIASSVRGDGGRSRKLRTLLRAQCKY
jgi:hypothetical protein